MHQHGATQVSLRSALLLSQTYSFDLLSISVSLYQMMEVNQFRGFDEKQIRKLSSSITQCLQFLKRERIIHGDLKPVRVAQH